MSDEYWMSMALKLAKKAEESGEVPVGAIVVRGDEMAGVGYNQMISANDPTAHAEIIALRVAGMNAKNYRLPGTTLYVTLEPCCMCVGAMVHARVERLVFGAYDPKTGAAGSCFDLLQPGYHNHDIEVLGGVMGEECADMLSTFFKQRRSEKKK